MEDETYLGDAVYASFDGYQIKLRTGDGNNQVIYLDPGAYHSLTMFVERLRERAQPEEEYGVNGEGPR